MNIPKPKLPPLKFCRVIYSPVYHPFYISKVFLEDKTHPLYLPITARWNARPKVGLWWSATGNTMAGKKTVVRRWCARRLRNAFREALEEKGFDENGKRLVEANLNGCLQMDTKEGIVKAKFEEIKREAGMILEFVTKMSQREVKLKGGSGAENRRWQIPRKFTAKNEFSVRKTVGTVPIQLANR